MLSGPFFPQILSDPLFTFQGSWDPPLCSVWWPGNHCWHSCDQNSQVLALRVSASSPLQGNKIVPGRVLAPLFFDFLDFACLDKALPHDSQIWLLSFYSPKYLPYISVYCFLCPISTVPGVHISPSPDSWFHEFRNSVSFSSDYLWHLIQHLKFGIFPKKKFLNEWMSE